jgi:hypothetical protein
VPWAINPADPSVTQTIVMDALASLSHLQDVELNLHGNPCPLIHLDRFSALKRISVTGINTECCLHIISGLAEMIAKSPQLAHLEVNTCAVADDDAADHMSEGEIPTLHDLFSKIPLDSPLRLTHLALQGMCARVDSFTLPHLRSLVSLNSDSLFAPCPANNSEFNDRMRERASTISDFYATLQREKIHLKQVVIEDDMDDVILDYLCSYSGLETLDLGSIDSVSTKTSDALSYRFFKSVLPKHVDSIQALHIRPGYEGGWCYNTDNIFLSLAQCNNLRFLSVALTAPIEAHTTINFHVEVCLLDNLAAFLYPSHRTSVDFIIDQPVAHSTPSHKDFYMLSRPPS